MVGSTNGMQHRYEFTRGKLLSSHDIRIQVSRHAVLFVRNRVGNASVTGVVPSYQTTIRIE